MLCFRPMLMHAFAEASLKAQYSSLPQTRVTFPLSVVSAAQHQRVVKFVRGRSKYHVIRASSVRGVHEQHITGDV